MEVILPKSVGKNNGNWENCKGVGELLITIIYLDYSWCYQVLFLVVGAGNKEDASECGFSLF